MNSDIIELLIHNFETEKPRGNRAGLSAFWMDTCKRAIFQECGSTTHGSTECTLAP